MELHERMGHPSCERMCDAVSGRKPTWKNTGLTAKQIRKVFRYYTCIPCAAAKRNTNPPRDRSNEDRYQWKPGECFSCDPAVKINPKGHDGSDCFFLFKDLGTGYLYPVITDSKKASAFVDAFKEVLSFFQLHEHKTKKFRSDSEAIFLSAEARAFLLSKNIEPQYSAPDCHYQVSVERDMQTLFKGLSTVLNSSPFLRYDLWPNALREYCERKNRTPNSACNRKSPHQVITGERTDVSTQFAFKFGDVVLAATAPRNRENKITPKNEVGIYLGQAQGGTGHNILFLHTNKISVNDNVTKLNNYQEEKLREWVLIRQQRSEPVYDRIDDSFFDLLADEQPPQPTTITISEQPVATSPQPLSADIITQFFGEDILKEFSKEEQEAIGDSKFIELLHKYASILVQQPIKSILKRSSNPIQPSNDIQQQHDSDTTTTQRSSSPTNKPANEPPPRNKLFDRVTRSSVNKTNNNQLSSNLTLLTPHLFLPYNATYPAYVAMNLIYCNATKSKAATNDSPSVKQALMMEDQEKWKQAIRTEIESLMKQTLQPVDISKYQPGTYEIIPTTTQLKRKRNAINNMIEKYKARVCARGDLILNLLTSEDTYSPTISPLTFALILQLAVIFGMKKKTIDTVGAYLYQAYPSDKRQLFTTLDSKVAEVCNLDPNQVYMVLRYIYGLPDAGKAYYEAYSKLLMDNDYVRSAMDPCLFYKITSTDTTFIVIHVDDTFIFSTSDTAINSFINVLQSSFDITINDEADSYLGVFFDEDESTGNVTLRQPKLIQSIIDQYSAQVISPPSTITTKEYQQLLGSLMYLTKSRPDIQTSISFAATHAKNPTLENYIDLLKLVKYIEQTKDYGLVIRKYDYSKREPLQLYCHVDASYLTHEDSKSHTGYTLSFGQIGTFYSKSSKQPLVSTSSTHAEARALYTLLQDIIYVTSICQELKVDLKLPVQVFEDNFPVVQLTNNLAPKAKKCKHFLMLINYIKEQIEHGIISVQHVDTDENIADVLTKLLTGLPFYLKANKLLGRDIQKEDPPMKKPRKSRFDQPAEEVANRL